MTTKSTASLSLDAALALLHAGRTADAEIALRGILAHDPQHAEGPLHLARLLIDLGRLGEAAEVLWAAVHCRPDRASEYGVLAFVLAQSGVAGAKALLHRAAAHAPGDVVSRYRVGERLESAGEAHAAAYHFARAAGTAPATEDQWQWLFKAMALIRTHRVDEAEAVLRRLLEREPRHVEATYHLVQLLIGQARFDEAVARLATVMAPGPDDAASRRRSEFTYVVFQLTEKGVSAAVPLLQTIVEHSPGDVVAIYRMGEALVSRGELAAADAYFEQAARTHPSSADPWQPLYHAMALVRTGRPAEAEKALRAQLQVDGHPIEVAYHLCRLLIGRHRLPEAAAVLATEIECSTRLPPGARRVRELAPLAVELAELGVREAATVLAQLADQSPDDPVIRYRLATAIARHAPADAVAHFQRAAAEPVGAGAEPRLYQALALTRLGRIDEAMEALRHLLAAHPGYRDALHHLSQLYLDHGRPSDSLALLASFVGTLQDRTRPPERTAELSYQLHRLAHAGFKDAVPLLRRVADLAPGDIPVHFRLADALSMFAETAAATHYSTSAAEATPPPRDVWAWHYKALALRRLGRDDDAEAALRHTLSLDAPPVETSLELIQRLIATQRLAEAVGVLDAAIAAAGPGSVVLMPLALELTIRGIGAADVLRQRIVDANAADEQALTYFAQVAYYYSLAPEAIEHLDKLRARSDSPVRRIDSELLVPYVLSNQQDARAWVDRFTRGARALLESDVTVDNPLATITGPPYYHFFTFGIDTRDVNRQAARVWQAAHPALNWSAPHCLSVRRRPVKRRLRIGFLTQPTYPLMWGVARALDRNDFEVVHLHEPMFPMTPTAPWLGAAERHVTVPSTVLTEARQVIAEQELDVLIHTPFTPLRYFLSHARLAPVQCVLCEPCYTDGVENLDYYISWAPVEPEPLDDWYGCAVALTSAPPYWIQQDYTRLAAASRSDFPLPQEARWYLCPSASPKLQPQFDRVAARILAGDPNGVLVFLRGDVPLTRFAVERTRRAVAPAGDRVYSLPTLPEGRAHALLGLADCVLDALPIGGMSSSFAAIHAGVPTVTMPQNIPFGRWMTAMYETIGVTDLIASTDDDYVRLALRLASDAAWKAGLAARIKAGGTIFVENQAGVRELETFLRAAVAAAHDGTQPRHWKDGRFGDRPAARA